MYKKVKIDELSMVLNISKFALLFIKAQAKIGEKENKQLIGYIFAKEIKADSEYSIEAVTLPHQDDEIKAEGSTHISDIAKKHINIKNNLVSDEMKEMGYYFTIPNTKLPLTEKSDDKKFSEFSKDMKLAFFMVSTKRQRLYVYSYGKEIFSKEITWALFL